MDEKTLKEIERHLNVKSPRYCSVDERQYQQNIRALIAEVRRQEEKIAAMREELVDMLETVFHEHAYMRDDGWYSHSCMSDQEHAADRLVELGVYEQHPTEDWYRGVKRQNGG